jgi:hypothetical protein
MVQGDIGAGSTVLDDLWASICTWLEEADLVVFPSVPVAPGPTLTAVWPSDDWQTFLAIAGKMQVGIVFAERTSFGESDYLELVDANSEEEGGTQTDELAQLKAYIGSTLELRLAFSVDGVLLEWQRTADWWLSASQPVEEGSLIERHEALAEADRRSRKELAHRSDGEGWVRALAEDRRFREADRRGRHAQATSFLADKGIIIDEENPGQRMAVRRFTKELFHAAQDLYTSEVQPALEEEALANVSQFYQELLRGNPMWQSATVKVRESIARRFIREHYGIPMPEAVDVLARYKPEGPSQDPLLLG